MTRRPRMIAVPTELKTGEDPLDSMHRRASEAALASRPPDALGKPPDSIVGTREPVIYLQHPEDPGIEFRSLNGMPSQAPEWVWYQLGFRHWRPEAVAS